MSLRRRSAPIFLLAMLLPLLGGCFFQKDLRSPFVVYAPYQLGESAPAGELIFAVAPLRNESGVSLVDELAITDELAYQIERAEGLAALPVNRTLEAMRALGIATVSTPAEARTLARAMGADAIVVGTITAWDPYEPPVLGLSVAMYSGSRRIEARAEMDPFELQRATTDQQPTGPTLPDRDAPLSAVSSHLDASDHIVRSKALRYAWGRVDKRAPMGAEEIVKSMERYTEFCCFVLVEGLMDAERVRLERERAVLQASSE
ncbi:MAG: hypothetical protein AAGB34_10030 [Planctomycetota bacterium]